MKTYFLYYGACTKMCPRQHYILKLSKHYIHTYKQSLWMCSPFLLFAMCFNNNTEVEVYSYFAVEVASVLCIWNRCANFGLELEFRCFCSHFLFNWLSLHCLSFIPFWKFYLKSIYHHGLSFIESKHIFMISLNVSSMFIRLYVLELLIDHVKLWKQ